MSRVQDFLVVVLVFGVLIVYTLLLLLYPVGDKC